VCLLYVLRYESKDIATETSSTYQNVINFTFYFLAYYIKNFIKLYRARIFMMKIFNKRLSGKQFNDMV